MRGSGGRDLDGPDLEVAQLASGRFQPGKKAVVGRPRQPHDPAGGVELGRCCPADHGQGVVDTAPDDGEAAPPAGAHACRSPAAHRRPVVAAALVPPAATPGPRLADHRQRGAVGADGEELAGVGGQLLAGEGVDDAHLDAVAERVGTVGEDAEQVVGPPVGSSSVVTPVARSMRTTAVSFPVAPNRPPSATSDGRVAGADADGVDRLAARTGHLGGAGERSPRPGRRPR